MKKSFAVMALLAAGIFVAPAVRAQDDASMDPALMAAAPVQYVSPADVLKMLQDKRTDIALVDTQPVDGYVAGHIPGAINYPWVMRIKRFPIDLPRNKTLIMYGSCGHDTEDLLAQLAEFGYTNVKVMDGGWYKWLELKYPATLPETSPAAESSVSQLTAQPSKSDKTASAAK
jgi:3-mercaptopyruvate sulfurtransferase SseA